MRIKIIMIVLAVGFFCIAAVIVTFRLDANQQYNKYYDYSIQTLLAYGPLVPFDVKPDYQTLHPAKMLKLFKIELSSYTADRLARVNTVDATMFLFAKMFTLTIRPDYAFNLPMLSVDFICMGPKRVFVIEVIDPAKIDDDNKRLYYERMRVWQDTVENYEQSSVSEWSKAFITDFSIHITAEPGKDDELFEIYRTFLESYLEMAKNARPLQEDSRSMLQASMEKYVDTLLASGGPAVDFLKSFMTEEKQREYVRTAMFGLDP